MAKGSVQDSLDNLEDKLDDLSNRLQAFEDFDENIERTIEAKVFELRTLAYVTLIIVSVLLAFVVGAAIKVWLG